MLTSLLASAMGASENVLKFLILLSPLVCGRMFPENFKRCHLSDENFDNCLATTMETAFQLIGSSGIPSLKIPPIDLVEVSRMEIGEGTRAVNLVQRYTDLKTYGFSKLKVIYAHYDQVNKVLNFTSTYPQILQKGHYDINGKILVLPVFGDGQSTITLTNATLNHSITFKEEIKNNKNYFTVMKYDIKIDIEKAHYDFRNLFNGDEKLGDNILKVVNENWDTIWQDVKEGVEKSYSEVFRLISDGFFRNSPIDEIFLK